MTLALIHSRARLGLQAPAVTIEVHLSAGLPGFQLVGLAETTVREARDRVRSALLTCGFEFLRISVCPDSCSGVVRPPDLFFVTTHFLTYFDRFSHTFFPLRFAA